MNHLNESQLNEYLDGLMDTAAQSAIEAHLAACADCRAALDELQDVFLALDEVNEVALTTDLSAGVLANLNHVDEPATWLQPFLFVQVAAAIGMTIWLWPSLMRWLNQGESALRLILASIEPVRLNKWAQIPTWGTAVWQQIQSANPTINLAAGQWTWLVGLALIAWLAGNRLLFINEQ